MTGSLPLEGKTILITGGTDGIGLVTAENLARQGARLTILARNPQKSADTVEQIKNATGNPNVDYLVADLSVQSQVRRATAEFRARHDRLDVLLNNAGAVFVRRQLSADGLEMTFALNHMAYFILTLELLDLVKAAAPARIVNVSSMAHQGAVLNFDDLQSERLYRSWDVYSRSKLANLYFTFELARRLQGTGVTVNALHPGFVSTNFGRSNGGIFRPLFWLSQRVAISPEEGAQTSIHLASSPAVEGITGKYFVRSKVAASSRASQDADAARRLWQISEQLAGMPQPVI